MKVARLLRYRRKVFIETRFASAVRRSGRRILALIVPVLAALGLLPTATAAGAASPVQAEILWLFFIILVFALIIGVLVHVLLLATVAWYRDSPRWRPGKGPIRTHDKRLEIGWTVGPVIILAAVVIVTLYALPNVERPRHYDYALDVIGAQWAWRYEYPDWNATARNIVSSGTMYIQRGVTFLLRIHAEDVIHSFYVPDLGIKIDAVPGITNIFWVRGDITGTYTVQCAEFCGMGHSQMHGTVVVFAPGTQTIPYGPPPGLTQPGAGSPLYTIVDVEFKEHPGCTDKPWSIIPCRIEVGANFNVTLRVWNNESGTHQFRIALSPEIEGPQQPGNRPGVPIYININNTGPGNRQVEYWCEIPGHKDQFGMVGILNVTGPQPLTIVLDDTSIRPAKIEAGLGWRYDLTIRNDGSSGHTFGIGPPYNFDFGTIPAGTSIQRTVVLNRTTGLTTGSTWYGGVSAADQGLRGELQVVAVGKVPPPPPSPPGFPIVQITFGLAGLAALSALALNFKLARAARRRQRFPPEEG